MLKQVSDEKNRKNKSPVLCSLLHWKFYLCLPAWKKRDESKVYLMLRQPQASCSFLVSSTPIWTGGWLRKGSRGSHRPTYSYRSVCIKHTHAATHKIHRDRHTLREPGRQILCQSLEETFSWQNEWNLIWEGLSAAPDSNVNVYQMLIWATVYHVLIYDDLFCTSVPF